MTTPPPRPVHGARRYPDTLPDSPTLGLELPPVCVGDHQHRPPHPDGYHSDDYNSETRVGDEDEDEDEEGLEEDQVEGEDESDEGETNADWHWQCHLCAHINPLPPFYRDFDSVPLTLSQPCGNTAVPPREPSYSYSPVVPEEGSWEARMRGLEVGKGEAEGKSTYAQLVYVNLAGPNGGTTGLGTGQVSGSTVTAGPSTTPTHLATATAMGTVAVGKAGINYASMPLNYAFSTADASRSGPSTPIRYRGTGVRAWPGLGSAMAPKIAVGRVGADPSVSTTRGANAPPMARAGGNLYVRDMAKVVSAGSGIVAGAGAGAGTGMSSECSHRRCEGCYDLDADKRVVRFCGGSEVDLNRYMEWYASFGLVDGIEPAVVEGRRNARQREWHRGADIRELLLEGEKGGDEAQPAAARGAEIEGRKAPRSEYEGVRLGEGVEYRGVTERGEERFIAFGEEVLVSRNDPFERDVTEMRRDGPSLAQPQPRTGSPVRYTSGESRILRIQTADGSDDDSREDTATKASSDDGERFFGDGVGLERERRDDEDDGEESESDGSQGWVEPITFVHRGSQEGGGMSESESDEGADGDDEREDEEEGKGKEDERESDQDDDD